MKYFVGTSGYSYAAWKGIFYPPKLPAKEMLGFYSEHFSAVEINGTFRKLPKLEAVKSWIEQVPKGFRFTLKAPQAITHFKRLKEAEGITNELLTLAKAIGKRQGPVLFQLPPNFKKDLPRLDAFLTMLDGRAPCAFEFRHASWFDDEVFNCMKTHRCGLCIADADDLPQPEFVATANWAYLRLRREKYTAKQLQLWIDKLLAAKLREAYVFFKHEDTGSGPKLATRFIKLVDSLDK
ncbi:MAG TPA: DUF72 domain-containing protein [Lacipirellulaceae bacterium]|nr:DUF72 domain-containing protein [Lacipirellulaceae bacterium]